MPRCVGVLAAWSIVQFFSCDSTMFFFPRKLGHHHTFTKLLFSRFPSPHSPNHDSKSLMQVAYGEAVEYKFARLSSLELVDSG